MLRHQLNLDEFYDKGYTVNEIEPELADGLLSVLKGEPFVAPEKICGGDIDHAKNIESSYGDVVEPSFNVKLKEALGHTWEC